MQLALRPYQGKGIAAQAIAGRFQDSQTNGRDHGGVDSIAALFQHIQSGLGS